MRNKFLSYLRDVRRYSERTCSIYSEVLDEFVRFCEGSEDFGTLMNVNAIRAYEVYLMDTRKLSSRTVSQHLSVLSSFCRFLIKQNVIQSNPDTLGEGNIRLHIRSEPLELRIIKDDGN